MHQMFLLIGLGERGGSGVPKIYSGWRSQHWRPQALYEKAEHEQTLLELRMLDLLPEGVVEQLRERFGVRFEGLEHTARLILATAAIKRVASRCPSSAMPKWNGEKQADSVGISIQADS
ncbi:hypothetical protein ABDX87_15325 [Pseudomonas abietaniphila]|uniref:hypothetical protein n=1 Tax=Pseudomonas abietaniphila TaxID=89065 RepID=UPI003216A322